MEVRFKLLPNGRAQLIQIEKGSGAREIDEAGIYAVINAQPFLPFPSELEEDAVTQRTFREMLGVHPDNCLLTHTYCPACFTQIMDRIPRAW